MEDLSKAGSVNRVKNSNQERFNVKKYYCHIINLHFRVKLDKKTALCRIARMRLYSCSNVPYSIHHRLHTELCLIRIYAVSTPFNEKI